MLDDALGLMETGIAKASATVERAEATRECVWVTGGRLRLQQVFVNLISNALDAMETSQSPTIEIDLERPAPDRVRVLVRDRGAGLSDDVVGQVFDPFFTTKTPGKGLGLGLSISYNIIEDFGGHLSAGNRDDGGAWFAVDLSVAAAPQDVARDTVDRFGCRVPARPAPFRRHQETMRGAVGHCHTHLDRIAARPETGGFNIDDEWRELGQFRSQAAVVGRYAVVASLRCSSYLSIR